MRDFETLVEEISAKSQSTHTKPYMVAIDGFAGAGKSTIANALVARLGRAQSITLDDFYHALSLHQQRLLRGAEAQAAYFNAIEFRDRILQPLCCGESVSWQRLDWVKQIGAEQCQLTPQDIVVVEGVFASHEALRPFNDYTIFVDASESLRVQRVLARPQEDRHWWHHWHETESWFHYSNRSQERATSIVNGY